MVNLITLNSRTEWALTFNVCSSLHIGGKDKEDAREEKAKAEQYALMGEDGAVFLIPGSSFRGVTRSYLADLGKGLQLSVHKEERLLTLLEELYGRSDGTKSLRGRIWFSDVTIAKSARTIKNVTPIDRLTHKPLAPLTVHAVKEGTIFKVTMTIDNPTDAEYGLVGLLLRAFYEELIPLGAAQGRGLGRIQLIESETTIRTYNLSKKEATLAELRLGGQAQSILLGTVYHQKQQAEQMYSWLQFGADALVKVLEGASEHVY